VWILRSGLGAFGSRDGGEEGKRVNGRFVGGGVDLEPMVRHVGFQSGTFFAGSALVVALIIAWQNRRKIAKTRAHSH